MEGISAAEENSLMPGLLDREPGRQRGGGRSASYSAMEAGL
jgi:hypothetical protein